jgi:Holliday junction resolvasome RuvABC endonuclease subunit
MHQVQGVRIQRVLTRRRATHVIGIDPGIRGAVAVLDASGRVASLDDTPSAWAVTNGRRRRTHDVAGMRSLLARWARNGHAPHAAVEVQHPMPRQGVTSMFSTGYGYGLWIGLLAGMGIPYTLVHARRWQAALLGSGGRAKDRSVAAASALFPGQPLPRSRHGRADALLLAEFGRRSLAAQAPPIPPRAQRRAGSSR